MTETKPSKPRHERTEPSQRTRLEQEPLSDAERHNIEEEIKVPRSETAGPLPARRTTEEVRQGHTGDHVGHILGISFLGAIIALVAVLLLMFL